MCARRALSTLASVSGESWGPPCGTDGFSFAGRLCGRNTSTKRSSNSCSRRYALCCSALHNKTTSPSHARREMFLTNKASVSTHFGYRPYPKNSIPPNARDVLQLVTRGAVRQDSSVASNEGTKGICTHPGATITVLQTYERGKSCYVGAHLPRQWFPLLNLQMQTFALTSIVLTCPL